MRLFLLAELLLAMVIARLVGGGHNAWTLIAVYWAVVSVHRAVEYMKEVGYGKTNRNAGSHWRR